MSWSLVGRAALEQLPGPHLRLDGAQRLEIRVDGCDSPLPLSGLAWLLQPCDPVRRLLSEHPAWRVLIRATDAAGHVVSLHLGPEGAELSGICPVAVAAILEEPWLAMSQKNQHDMQTCLSVRPSAFQEKAPLVAGAISCPGC
ncbi:unnamed protein product [Effrenium voratum]|nr:unnamed protein product [Effrenium voratum]